MNMYVEKVNSVAMDFVGVFAKLMEVVRRYIL